MRSIFLLNQARAFSQAQQVFPKVPGNQKIKRFYKDVNIIEHPKTKELGQEWFMERIDDSTKNVTLEDLSRVYEGETFYAVQLDKRIIKTMYKDELLIPSKALAVVIAEEWES